MERTASNRRATSSAGRLAVGSSMTTILAEVVIARAMATSDFSGPAERAHSRVRIDINPDAVKRLPGGVLATRPGDKAEAAVEAAGQRHVFADRHPIDETKILMDEGDWQVANPAGRGRPRKRSPLVEIVNTRKDLDQRRFSGSILPEESEHLAFAEIETHILQRIGAAELLMDIADAQKRCQTLGASRCRRGAQRGLRCVPEAREHITKTQIDGGVRNGLAVEATVRAGRSPSMLGNCDAAETIGTADVSYWAWICQSDACPHRVSAGGAAACTEPASSVGGITDEILCNFLI